jgi:hypothetical protein
MMGEGSGKLTPCDWGRVHCLVQLLTLSLERDAFPILSTSGPILNFLHLNLTVNKSVQTNKSSAESTITLARPHRAIDHLATS